MKTTSTNQQYLYRREQPIRLDRLLTQLQPQYSRSRWQQEIKAGQVLCNGKLASAAQLIADGDRVNYQTPATVAIAQTTIKSKLAIKYEDASLLIISKPPRIPVHPGAGQPRTTLVDHLQQHCQGNLPQPQSNRPGIVHRLDQDTSGLMLVAKTETSYQALSQAIANRQITRIYLALVSGALNRPYRLTNFWQRDSHNLTRLKVLSPQQPRLVDDWVPRTGQSSKTKPPRLMISDFLPLTHTTSGGSTITLVLCRLFTGRTHQIRLQLAHLGYPVLGDKKYGTAPATVTARQCLHACLLQLQHPETAAAITAYDPLPPDLSQLFATLQLPDSEQLQSLVYSKIPSMLAAAPPTPTAAEHLAQ